MYLQKQSKKAFVRPKFKFLILYTFISLIISLISINSILTFFSLMVIVLALSLVWRKNEPPIFPFVIFYHWVQISMKVFHADLKGVDIQTIATSNSSDTATYLSLFGLLSLSFGIYVMIRKIKLVDTQKIIKISKAYSLSKLFRVYIIFFVIYVFLKGVMFVIPGLAQVIVGFLSFKVVLIYFIFLVALIQKRYKILMWVIIIETIFGMSGFFSSFKQPYILLFLAYFTVNYKISLRGTRFIIPIISLVVLMGLVWTAIKPAYRYALNQGSEKQEITVSAGKQVSLLVDNIGRIDLEILGKASEALASRLAYVDFFGQVIDYVPRTKDYEYGSLWFGAVTHVFKPRIFFPNKPILDDSLRTMKYTGHLYAALDKGASIGIGYFAESYIDFGRYFMYVPLFLLGIFYGFVYRYLIKNTSNPLLAYAMIVAILLIAYPYETRNDKLFGGIMMAFMMLLIMKKLFMSKLFKSSRVLKLKAK